jgi:Domain of unknown function (DUF5063)
MGTARKYQDIAEGFSAIARQYCAIVDTARSLDKDQLLLQIYRILPDLISAAIHFPDADPWDREGEGDADIGNPEKAPTARMTDEEWRVLCDILTQKLGDNNRHWDVFNPASADHEVVYGGLADDISDIYRELKEPLVLLDKSEITSEMAIWYWQLGFTSHWGHHAIEALKAIYCILHY